MILIEIAICLTLRNYLHFVLYLSNVSLIIFFYANNIMTNKTVTINKHFSLIVTLDLPIIFYRIIFDFFFIRLFEHLTVFVVTDDQLLLILLLLVFNKHILCITCDRNT